MTNPITTHWLAEGAEDVQTVRYYISRRYLFIGLLLAVASVVIPVLLGLTLITGAMGALAAGAAAYFLLGCRWVVYSGVFHERTYEYLPYRKTWAESELGCIAIPLGIVAAIVYLVIVF